MLYARKNDARRARKSYERTHVVVIHSNSDDSATCLYSDGTIIPKHGHTCDGRLVTRYQNRMKANGEAPQGAPERSEGQVR